jgi:hypothetical protein
MAISAEHPQPPESIYAAVTRWAAHAPPSTLRLLATLGLLAAAAILVLEWRRWPVAGALLSVSTVGAWGLLEQRATRPHSRAVGLAETLLAGLGIVVAALVGLGTLLWVLGPAPTF